MTEPTGGLRRLLTALLPVLLVASAATTWAPPAAADRVDRDFFGMHQKDMANGSVTTVGLGSYRAWNTGTSWRQIELRPGRFDWTRTDAVVANARSAGMRPLLVLGQTPRFHARHPRAAGVYGPGATSMPRLGPWKRYVRKAARRYGDGVDYQVWNEPNVVGYWRGTPRQMARLTVTASRALRDVVGRRATVVAPSFPLRLRGQQQWFERYWSTRVAGAGMARYVDVTSVNPYPMPDEGPEQSAALVRRARSALPRAARVRPMWNTEINYGLIDGSTPAAEVPMSRQRAYVARTLLLSAGLGVERVYWYHWTIGPAANTHLVGEDDLTVTPAGRAWDTVRGWLLRTQFSTCEQGRVWTCRADRSATEVRRFYWKPTGPAVRVRTPRSTTSWTDLSGTVTERRGRFGLTVGPAPVMVTSRR